LRAVIRKIARHQANLGSHGMREHARPDALIKAGALRGGEMGVVDHNERKSRLALPAVGKPRAPRRDAQRKQRPCAQAQKIASRSLPSRVDVHGFSDRESVASIQSEGVRRSTFDGLWSLV